MSVLNNSLRIFRVCCLLFNYQGSVRLRDSSNRLSYLIQLVKKFFKFFKLFSLFKSLLVLRELVYNIIFNIYLSRSFLFFLTYFWLEFYIQNSKIKNDIIQNLLVYQRHISKRRKRDLNPRAAINDLLPFQGSPFGQLGYFSKLPYAIASVFCRSVLYYIALFFICQELF